MLSTVSAVDPLPAGNPLTAFHGGFTPWESLESFFTSPNPDTKPIPGLDLSRYHAGLGLGSDDPNQTPPSFDQEPNQNPAKSNSGSENPSRNSAGLNSGNSCDSNPNSSGSGSDELNQIASVIDERKRRRMISNRESARRSRMRKQNHIENLRNKVNQLKTQNRGSTNRLRLIIQYIHLVRRENDRLRTESIFLQRRLTEYCKIMQLQQLQQNYSSSSSSTPMQAHAIYNYI